MGTTIGRCASTVTRRAGSETSGGEMDLNDQIDEVVQEIQAGG